MFKFTFKVIMKEQKFKNTNFKKELNKRLTKILEIIL